MLKRFFVLCALVLPLSLAACDTAEERAQKHYEKSLALLEEGDVDRALVELRNVFKLDGYHVEARLTYAQVSEEQGNLAEAFSQYLRLVEQMPEHLGARKALAYISAISNNWEEAEQHLAVVEPQLPDDLLLRSVRVGLDYRTGIRENDQAAQTVAAEVASALLQDDLSLQLAQMVALENLMRNRRWDDALALLDRLFDVSDAFQLHRARLSILEQIGARDEMANHLRVMVQKFPDTGLHRTLVNFLTQEGRWQAAEAYLRDRVQEAELGEEAALRGARLELLGFVAQQKGAEVAIAEVDMMLATQPANKAQLEALRANLEFEQGKREAAIAALDAILADAEDSAEVDGIKILQARMFNATGNSVGARARVEEVLEHDAGHLGAIKMKASWLIGDDQPGDALVELRNALDSAPRDPDLLTLMAQAHQRSGDQALMQEMLAMAVEVSGSRPAETLRYANHLIEKEKFFSAEEVMLASLRQQSAHIGLLNRLGALYIQTEDWARSRQVVTRLEALGSDQAQQAARELTARLLSAQNRAEDLEAFLTGLSEGQGDLGADAAIVRLRLANGDVEGALKYSTVLLERDPGNPNLRFLQAGVLASEGRLQPAAAIMTDLVAEYPNSEQSWLALYRMRRSLGDDAGALASLEQAETALPESANIKWIRAGLAETEGDFEQAIAIYETLYAQNSASPVLANNLASLMASYRDDDPSLERALVIARRLRGSEVPAFQDTYGWIATRLGNYDEALPYLESAARGLPQDPVVQFHLGELYRLMGRLADARPYYQAVLDLVEAGAVSPPFLAEVQAQLQVQN